VSLRREARKAKRAMREKSGEWDSEQGEVIIEGR
jgi:hypothetical protein